MNQVFANLAISYVNWQPTWKTVRWEIAYPNFSYDEMQVNVTCMRKNEVGSETIMLKSEFSQGISILEFLLTTRDEILKVTSFSCSITY